MPFLLHCYCVNVALQRIVYKKNGEQTVCKTNRGRVIEGDNSHGTRGGKQGQIVHKTAQYLTFNDFFAPETNK